MNSEDSTLLEQLSQFDGQQRLRFYEVLASRLTVVNRVIWADEKSSSETKVEKLKNVNEIMHRVVRAISTVRVAPREWSDEVMIGEIRRWIAQDPSIRGDVAWAIQESLERVRTLDEQQRRTVSDPLAPPALPW
jgi:hypothetical protein